MCLITPASLHQFFPECSPQSSSKDITLSGPLPFPIQNPKFWGREPVMTS